MTSSTVHKLAILVLVITAASVVPAQPKPPKPPKSHETPAKCEPRLGSFKACDASEFTPTIDVPSVHFTQAKPAAPADD